MTFEEMTTALASLSFPVEFDHVKAGTYVPFATYTFSIEGYSADCAVYTKGYQFMLRVFLEKLDATIDAEIETLLAANKIVWTRDDPIYYEDMEVFEIDYNFGILAG